MTIRAIVRVRDRNDRAFSATLLRLNESLVPPPPTRSLFPANSVTRTNNNNNNNTRTGVRVENEYVTFCPIYYSNVLFTRADNVA